MLATVVIYAHVRFEEQIEDGKLSRDGQAGAGGLEAVAAGGMHTLTIDEGGRVSSLATRLNILTT